VYHSMHEMLRPTELLCTQTRHALANAIASCYIKTCLSLCRKSHIPNMSDGIGSLNQRV